MSLFVLLYLKQPRLLLSMILLFFVLSHVRCVTQSKNKSTTDFEAKTNKEQEEMLLQNKARQNNTSKLVLNIGPAENPFHIFLFGGTP